MLALSTTFASTGCAPVVWQDSQKAVVSRTIEESPPRRLPSEDGVEVEVVLDGTDVVARVERTDACAVDIVERTMTEQTSRAEPDKTWVVVDHALVFAGLVTMLVGVGVGASCLSRDTGACGAPAPLLLSGAGTTGLGLGALFVDAEKRRTRVTTKREAYDWPTSVRACGRAPVGNAPIELDPDFGKEITGKTDSWGIARMSLAGHRPPFDVEVRVFDHRVRRVRIQ